MYCHATTQHCFLHCYEIKSGLTENRRSSLCIANYTVPETEEQFCPPATSIQLLSTNKTSDDNLPSIFCESLRGDLGTRLPGKKAECSQWLTSCCFTIFSHIALLCSLCSLCSLFALVANQEAWSVCSAADLNRFNTLESSCTR